MKKIIALLGIVVVALPIRAQEVGIQLYSLRNQFKVDVTGTLDIIASWGITELEGGETYGMSMADFKKELVSRKMSVVSVGASFEDLKSNPQKVIESARGFGATYVMCAWVPHDDNTWDLKETEMAIKVFNTAGKILKKNGLILAYHPHGYEFRPYKDGTLFDYMVEKATDFTFELDVFWAHHGGGDPLALMKKYPKKIPLLHLKDMAEGVIGNNTGHADDETNVVLGTGQVGIAEIVAEAKKMGIDYMFIEDESSSVVAQVPESLGFLKSLED